MTINNLNNSSFFINGVSSQLSAAIAERLAGLGAKLFITDTDDEKLSDFKNVLNAGNANISTYHMRDMNSFQIEKSVGECFEKLKSFGCAINNYILPEADTNIIDCSIDYWNSFIKLNLSRFSAFLKYELSLMAGLKSGCIINTFTLANPVNMGECHATYTFLKAAMGLSEITSNTYKENKINIFSFYPEEMVFLEEGNEINRKIKTSQFTEEDGDLWNSVNEILNVARLNMA